MPTITAGNTATVAVDYDTTINTDGTGRYKFTPTTGSVIESSLTGTQVLGPFRTSGSVLLSAITALVYTTGNAYAVDNKTVAVTASRDAVLSDSGNMLLCNSASAIAITIQSDATTGWSADEVIGVYQAGAGAVTFTAGASVTLRGTAPTLSQYGTMGIIRVGANEWAYL